MLLKLNNIWLNKENKIHEKIFATIKHNYRPPLLLCEVERHIFRVTDDKKIINGTTLNHIHKLQIDKDTIKAWYETVYVDGEVIIECTPSTLAFT